MLDAFAYTSERVAPVTGPRAPEDRKAKVRKAPGPARPNIQPGSAIVVSPGILEELHAVSSAHYPRLNLLSPGLDPFFTGYPIVSDPQLAGLHTGMLA